MVIINEHAVLHSHVPGPAQCPGSHRKRHGWSQRMLGRGCNDVLRCADPRCICAGWSLFRRGRQKTESSEALAAIVGCNRSRIQPGPGSGFSLTCWKRPKMCFTGFPLQIIRRMNNWPSWSVFFQERASCTGDLYNHELKTCHAELRLTTCFCCAADGRCPTGLACSSTLFSFQKRSERKKMDKRELARHRRGSLWWVKFACAWVCGAFTSSPSRATGV